jgi:hypothetical protein
VVSSATRRGGAGAGRVRGLGGVLKGAYQAPNLAGAWEAY